MGEYLIELNKEKQENIKLKKRLLQKKDAVSKGYDEIIKLEYKESGRVYLKYILNKNDKLCLIERLDRYRENHLMFVKDFQVEFTNNELFRKLYEK